MALRESTGKHIDGKYNCLVQLISHTEISYTSNSYSQKTPEEPKGKPPLVPCQSCVMLDTFVADLGFSWQVSGKGSALAYVQYSTVYVQRHPRRPLLAAPADRPATRIFETGTVENVPAPRGVGVQSMGQGNAGAKER